MVILKTKLEKHSHDDERRRKSIIEKRKINLNKSLIIKHALSNSTSHDNSSKKIVFDDDDDDDDDINSGKNSSNEKYSNKSEKCTLFDNFESEVENTEIKEKIQFNGEEGFKLLNLQSTYGNDERFKIDERFIEDTKKDFYHNINETSKSEQDGMGEKVKQLKILENVLGSPIIQPDQKKKKKKGPVEMIRYDVSNKDHEIYEVKPSDSSNSLLLPKKRKERNKKPQIVRDVREELTKPIVSEEKFYEVSKDIKNCFKEKEEENGQFSLLQTYSENSVKNSLEIKEDIIKNKDREKEEENSESYFIDEENFEHDNYKIKQKVGKKVVNKMKKEDKSVIAEGIWKEPFFFIEEDPRIKEGIQFINKKDSTEATEAAENYDQMRKKLKEILRLHLKKQLHKKDPFKKKIGGMNKKQLANSKFKNSKMIFNKKKSFKKNSGGKM